MSTHNVCFYGEITKIIPKIIPKLSSNTLLICITALNQINHVSTLSDVLMKELKFKGGDTISFNKWATSWENLFMPYVNNKGADQTVHLHSLISAFVVHCLYSIIPLVSISKISRLQTICVFEQAGFSLPWSETPKTGLLVTRLKWLQLSITADYVVIWFSVLQQQLTNTPALAVTDML